MTEEDAPWRSSRGLSLAPDALCELEDALSADVVFAAACVAGRTYAVIHDDAAEDDPRISIVEVESLDPLSWTVLSRHEWWGTEVGSASEVLAAMIDRRRDEIPSADEPDAIVPTIVVPCRNGIEVLHPTTGGVALTTQLFDRPDELVHDPDLWPSFEAAMSWVTYES